MHPHPSEPLNRLIGKRVQILTDGKRTWIRFKCRGKGHPWVILSFISLNEGEVAYAVVHAERPRAYQEVVVPPTN